MTHEPLTESEGMSSGDIFPDTEEVVGSNPIVPTIIFNGLHLSKPFHLTQRFTQSYWTAWSWVLKMASSIRFCAARSSSLSVCVYLFRVNATLL
jgi:hypothetical protein